MPGLLKHYNGRLFQANKALALLEVQLAGDNSHSPSQIFQLLAHRGAAQITGLAGRKVFYENHDARAVGRLPEPGEMGYSFAHPATEGRFQRHFFITSRPPGARPIVKIILRFEY